MLHCTGFGWDGITFLQSSPYAVLCVCDQIGPHKTRLFQLLLNSAWRVSRASLFLALTHQ